MIHGADVRKRKLGELLQNPAPGQAKQKLFYKGRSEHFTVHQIDLEWLIYNKHNGRLEAEMLTWKAEHAASPDVYDEELHNLIDDFLWKSNQARNEQTLVDLEEKEQQRPGIVSLDGVIIDGNRRAMLLRRLEKKHHTKKYFEAIILPDSYADNEEEIVRLETQYQISEDEKVGYGPLQKYLHAKRLRVDLGIAEDQVEKLMKLGRGGLKKLLGTLELMDEYLAHIGSSGLYTMLKDEDGTKEGMFVDLYSDLNKLSSGSKKVPWPYDSIVEVLRLKLIQFDYIRMGSFADAKKSYRQISHGKDNFFGHQDIWERFRDQHEAKVFPATKTMGSLQEFMEANPGYESKVDAARARDKVWISEVKGPMQGNFGRSNSTLQIRTHELKPREYLERAKELLERIDVDSPGLLADNENGTLALEINRLAYEIKKKFDRRTS